MKLPNIFSNDTKIKLSDNEVLFIVDSLSTMLSSGIPIIEALSSIEEDTTSRKTKKVVRIISENINSGKSLYESFGKFPESFNSVFLNIVKSGEASGNLDKVLKNAALSLKDSIQTKSNIHSALIYPIIIFSVLVSVGFLVFGYSLPKVAKVFFDLKLNLPDYSRTVLKIALWIGDNRINLLVGLFVAIFLIYSLLKIRPIKNFVLKIIFSLPIISNIVRLNDLANFTQTTGLLLSAAVPIIGALEISVDVVSSVKMKKDIKAVIAELEKGQNLGKSMQTSARSFPALLRRVVSVGEESGQLDNALNDISKYYQEKFAQIIKNLTVIIEPILIVVIASLVALILISVVLPIYQGIGSLNRH